MTELEFAETIIGTLLIAVPSFAVGWWWGRRRLWKAVARGLRIPPDHNP